MKIAFIGTSHIGSLKMGWDLLPLEVQNLHNPCFIGLSAPALSKQAFEGWRIEDDCIHSTLPLSNRYYLKLTSGSVDTPIIPAEYDVVCFVDMFFCYDFAVIYSKPFMNIIYSDDIPVSDNVYIKILEGLLGESQYTNHPLVGTIGTNSQIAFMKQVIDMNPKIKVFLTPRPFMPSYRLKSKYPNWNDPSMVCRVAELFNIASRNRLKNLGVEYIPRRKEQICIETGATPDHFSIGWDQKANTLNEHMNAEYGYIILQKVMESI